MPDSETPDLADDANLPPAVLPYLTAGRRARADEERQRVLAEEARKRARDSILAANRDLGAVELLKLVPAIAPLMEFATIDDRDDHTRTGEEFLGVEFKFSIPGFRNVLVWVFRKKPNGVFGPWELGTFRVDMYTGRDTQHPSLSYALAVAREEFLAHGSGHVPY